MAERAADFGTMMKRAREARGVSLRDIAKSTKLSVSALDALERNDISRLPGGIFSRAFVRAFAVEVGLEPEATVREFIAQFPHDVVTAGSPDVPQEDYAAVEGSRRSAETALKLVAIAVPIVALLLYFTAFRSPAPAAETSVPAPVEAAEPAPAAEPALPVGSEPLTFEVLATRTVTVDLVIDGLRRETHAIGAGDRFSVQADREIAMTISDAGAVQLAINGQPAVALGAAGEARTVQIGRRNYGAFLASQ